MNTEIERLIELAIADGEITDKERAVIIKKAEKFDVDPDEVEMILDGRLHESKKLKTKEKVGNIKVCPSCGESVKSFQLNCPSCGHELNSRKQSELLNTMTQKISLLNVDDLNYEQEIAKIVLSTTIPSSVNEIYEFGLYCVNSINSSSNSWREDSSAFEAKTSECISKLKISNSSNHNIELLVTELEKTLRDKKKVISKNNKNDWIIIGTILFLIGLIYFVAIEFLSD
ncbi:hypothetical protein DEJ39_02455 [Bacteroidetes bacterium SCGC AAA795-G10]|nr:hypothetical protein DEJ39_02455 [Bacteroidetes bacterium SCGC AAA795-G10]